MPLQCIDGVEICCPRPDPWGCDGAPHWPANATLYVDIGNTVVLSAKFHDHEEFVQVFDVEEGGAIFSTRLRWSAVVSVYRSKDACRRKLCSAFLS